MRPLVLLFLCCITFPACSQLDSVEGPVPQFVLKTIPVGESRIVLRQIMFNTEPPFVLLQLHSNESTAAAVAEKLARQEGIPFFQLINNSNRLVAFTVGGRQYQFDPNRVFSDRGIEKNLALTSRFTKQGFTAVRRFRDSLLSFFLTEKPIVAVHNNTNENFSIRQYGQLKRSRVHMNAAHDEDDFFITNDAEIFSHLKAKEFNVVLEDAGRLEEDGSLSLYCNRKQIRYINVEAEHGHEEEQYRMLIAVLQYYKQQKN
jgi:hypothetical protein